MPKSSRCLRNWRPTTARTVFSFAIPRERSSQIVPVRRVADGPPQTGQTVHPTASGRCGSAVSVATGITTIEKLKKVRAYVIVGAFAMGMLLTPPDVISQTLLALPMWLLFEIGILMSWVLLPDRRTTRGEAGDDARAVEWANDYRHFLAVRAELEARLHEAA